MDRERDKHGNRTDLSTIRVRVETSRRMQLAATFLYMSVSDYVDHLMSTQGAKDFQEMVKAVVKMEYTPEVCDDMQDATQQMKSADKRG